MPDPLDALIGDFYACALDPAQLPQALDRATRAISGDTCHLVGWSGREGRPTLSLSVGLDDGVGPDYMAHHARDDPRRSLAIARFREGELLLCHEHFDSRFVAGSGFFQDYLRPLGLHYLAAVTLVDNDDRLVQIAFQRLAGREPFAKREVRTIRRMVPHLKRALVLMCTMQEVRQHEQMALLGLRSAGVGLIGIASNGQVAYANTLGTAFLAEEVAIKLNGGRMQAIVPDCDQRLSALLGQCLVEGLAGHVRLPDHRSAGGDLICTLVPAPQAVAPDPLSSDRHAAALCLLTRARGGRLATARQLMDVYELSPAQARLARAIASGERLEAYAMEAGVKLPTVKTQLQEVFHKLGCSRQGEVRALVKAVLPVRIR
jgi:DNA-binding CsgD family transcriptional regulator